MFKPAALFVLAALLWVYPVGGRADPAPAATQALVQAALENITLLQRPGKDGYATVWDGDKYVQCHRSADGGFACEAAGMLMQPSLSAVLTPAAVARLQALGWRYDGRFGNYDRTFPAAVSSADVANAALQALQASYRADVTQIEVQTAWVASEPCPPRNGYSQNLAGMVNDAPAMQLTAVHACRFQATLQLPEATTADELVHRFQRGVSAEIQRLRVNLNRRVFVVFDTGIGYIQCQPQASPAAIYCEAQSAQSWPALGAVLTPDRIAKLHAAGYADPGRAPNYWKNYPVDQATDDQIAAEILTLLHDVYGYAGAEPLKPKTEAGGP
jgi:hypothetical protein